MLKRMILVLCTIFIILLHQYEIYQILSLSIKDVICKDVIQYVKFILLLGLKILDLTLDYLPQFSKEIRSLKLYE